MNQPKVHLRLRIFIHALRRVRVNMVMSYHITGTTRLKHYRLKAIQCINLKYCFNSQSRVTTGERAKVT